MASKGPRSKLDHESRAKRQKALEAPKEPWRPKTHWDHVLEEMAWLSKDFESERKWKLAHAKKVAMRASKGFLDQATRGEKRLKEEEHKLRRVALNISKDVKKFWAKIEKLVLYKHQLELDEKKKKALDKQLEFLLGQTERYSSMLAKNLVGSSTHFRSADACSSQKQLTIQWEKGEDINRTSESDSGSQRNVRDADEDFDLKSDDESEDDERTVEEDEALITKEERDEELAALHSEIDLPLEVILKRYAAQEVSREKTPGKDDNVLATCVVRGENGKESSQYNSSNDNFDHHCSKSNGVLSISENVSPHTETDQIVVKELIEADKRQISHEFKEEEDDDFELSAGEEKDHSLDDESTLIEEEKLADLEPYNDVDEIAQLQKESELPIEELIARYKEGCDADDMEVDSESVEDSDSDESMSSQGNSELKTRDNVFHDQHTESWPVAEDVEANEVEKLGKSREDMLSEDIMADAAAAARSAQPTGNTFSTTKVRTKFPFLLKYPLREYQHIGLDWLVTMYEKRLNGILADEMGLGKTIMTIALLAHLACEKGIWGPHLIVVPTSVMLNWETEFLKWCPAFKILTYFGSAKERRIKRQGWMKPNSFHVCITTYRLVIQDSKVFKRKKWKYLILDEAHLIKNWKSQRWQTLLNFNSKRRILLTGTPLQNDLMELWSLMHFLMPHIFQSHQEFKDWFSNPISGMVDGQDKINKEVVDRLHNVLRPFILRRLKKDVEKQLPKKHEHVIFCRLSRRQRNLYEDFIANSETQATLASANFFGMISVIMQLRKVCNHPDLFEGRPIISSYDMSGINVQLSSSVCSMLVSGPFSAVDLSGLGFVFTHLDLSMSSWESEETQAIATPSSLIEQRLHFIHSEENPIGAKYKMKMRETNVFEDIRKALLEDRQREAKERGAAVAWWNSLRCKRRPIYSTGLRELVTVKHPIHDIHRLKHNPLSYMYSSKLAEMVISPVERFEKMVDQVESFMFAIPAARAPLPLGWCSKGGSPVFIHQTYARTCSQVLFPLFTPYRPAIVRRQVYFPDRRLIQFDCGKLQELAVLLRKLKSEGHRALIFTQMTKMLDILETFISIYGYTYMRLDGSTQPEERQTLMQRFNTNPKIFLFILSTRSGGVGINLVGADTVIFYDSDWNPAMDQQAQDRCHRIGQTREVHIYRLISESTIEENILKKANQKRALDNLVIQSGSYNTEFFKKLDPMELFSGHERSSRRDMKAGKIDVGSVDINLSSIDLEAALKNAEDEADYMALKKVEEEEAVENQEFTEEAGLKLEDDELVNDDEMKHNEDDVKHNDPLEHHALAVKSDEHDVRSHPVDDEAIDFSGKEDDIDMLADVKQMAAAAAAAGEAVLSFENHLRPIDRYAIRFLELWNPIYDKATSEFPIQVEEKEWELEQIEKLKDNMEAENDDDEEPLIYESWDADFATEIYRQKVEALAQQQMMEDMEREAREKEALENGFPDSLRNNVPIASKPKPKKKTKKAKFKSLRKGSLLPNSAPLKEESSSELMLTDDDQCYDDLMTSSDTSSPCSVQPKKRKYASEYDDSKDRSKSKKLKSSEQNHVLLSSKSLRRHANEPRDMKVYENGTIDQDPKQIGRSKIRGKLSISLVPLKLSFTLKPDKIKKKGIIWSLDYIPFPDLWSPHEDAVLCAAVHEYGPNWNLASEILHGMTAGGFYRGRSRHPLHCSERFRELIQKHVLSVSDAINNDKSGSIGSGKGLLKVTEDNIHALLDVVSQLPDYEPLHQKHFFVLLSSAWRYSRQSDPMDKTRYAQSGFYPSHKPPSDEIDDYRFPRTSKKLGFPNLKECEKLVASALNSCCRDPTYEKSSSSTGVGEEVLVAKERLDLSLEPHGEKDEISPLPSIINVSIFGSEICQSSNMHPDESQDAKPFRTVVENPFKMRDERDSREFPTGDATCSAPQLQSSWLHKFLVRRRTSTTDHSDSENPLAGEVFPSMPLMPVDYDDLSSSSSPFFSDAKNIEFESTLPTDDMFAASSLGSSLGINQSAVKYELDDFSDIPDFTDIG